MKAPQIPADLFPQLLSLAAAIGVASCRYQERHNLPYQAVQKALGEGLSTHDWRVGRIVARAIIRGRFHWDYGLCMRAQELEYGDRPTEVATELFAKSPLLREYIDSSQGKIAGDGEIVAEPPPAAEGGAE
jgi:hypothetical protein